MTVQIAYNDSSFPLRFSYPTEWDPALISAITITCKDDDGEELLSAQSATLYTDTTLDEDADQYTSSIVLASGAGAVAPGDRMVIDGIEGTETVIIKAYDSSTRTAELEEILLYNHLDGDNVYATWATYNLDTSTVADFPKGLLFSILWTPTGDGNVTRWEAQIAASEVDLSGIQEQFKAAYPRAWETFRNPVGKFDIIQKIAERQIKNDLLAENNSLDFDRVVDQDQLMDVVMAKMAYIWALQGDENKTDEREAIGSELEAQMARLRQAVLWTDDDQDDDRDSEEVTDHEPIFNTNW